MIRDTDGGALDGDTAFDRAVGPMQFIPGTWKTFAKDGNNDGVASPHNVFDAAVAAGNYLCAGGGDLSQPAAQRAALLRYNRSDAYGALVLRWAAAYGAGVSVIPDGTGPVPSTPRRRLRRSRRRRTGRSTPPRPRPWPRPHRRSAVRPRPRRTRTRS